MSTSQIQRVNLSKVDHSLKSRRGKKVHLSKMSMCLRVNLSKFKTVKSSLVDLSKVDMLKSSKVRLSKI